MDARRLKIGLLWHSWGHGNLGVDALTRAHVAILTAAAERADIRAEFVLLGGVPAHAAQDLPLLKQGPRLRLKEVALGRSPFLAALKSCDVVLDISEGDSFTDIYGIPRFLFQAGTKSAALWYGRPLVLAPQTIGPFNRMWTRRVAAGVMRRCTRVYSRDGASSDALMQLGVSTNAAEAIDVAFRLPFTPATRRGRDTANRIGINVSGLLYRNGADFGLKLDYVALCHSLIKETLKLENTEVWLVPHVLSAGPDDDLQISQELAKEYSTGIRLAPRFTDSVVAKSFIAGLDFLVAGRMHAAIAGFSAGVPVYPVAYSRKFNGLFTTLGYPHFVDGRSIDTQSALASIKAGWDKREDLRRDIAPGLHLATQRLEIYESYLVSLLKDIKASVEQT